MTLLWRKVHQRSLVFMQVLLSELEFGVLVLPENNLRRKARTNNKLARGTTLPAHSLDHL